MSTKSCSVHGLLNVVIVVAEYTFNEYDIWYEVVIVPAELSITEVGKAGFRV